MKLLVTGGAGYVGSVCAARLLESGHDVTVVDDLSTGHADAIPSAARFVEADIAEGAGQLLAEGFDGVLHFAAKSLVAESMQEPYKYWQGNVVTSLRLLEAMREHRVPKLVFSSTAAAYGEPETSPIDEGCPTRPTKRTARPSWRSTTPSARTPRRTTSPRSACGTSTSPGRTARSASATPSRPI